MRGKGRVVVAAALAAAAILAVGGSAGAASPSVTLVGDLEHFVAGCGDWAPDCDAAHMTPGADGVDRIDVSLPAGDWQYKAAIGNSWNENYGLHAQSNGANVPLHLDSARTVRFYYDPATHWITDNVSTPIVSAPGSYQTQLGCGGDWSPDCLRSWLEDPDGDGVYTFGTHALQAGHYEVKAAVGESWDENYGAGGAPGGANIGFTVPYTGAPVTFSYSGSTHLLTVAAGHAHDGNVEWDGLRFDSRSTLYRAPAGAVPAGTPVKLRFRTFHDDVTSVAVRVWDVNANAQQILPMTRVAAGAPCFQDGLGSERCDYWQATLAPQHADVWWYRFVVRDGSSVAYYGDDTGALDGGLGAVTGNEVDNSWSLTAYDPAFQVPAWASHAVVYQVFPDRFRNGDRKNDPKATDVLYGTHPTLKAWSDRPEGYCRSYDTPCAEGPNGTDYFGGDLKGIREKLGWLRDEGFNTLYLNPIFWAKSNHRYDTADYLKIDPYLGDMQDFTQLVHQAHALGFHLILDGVFNHMSSDSPFFDRYGHYSTLGACESADSPYRSWFTFTGGNGPCVGGAYTGWAGFDSIPVLTKADPAVQSYFLTGPDSVTRHWLQAGSDGWRLDVMGDPSFPAGYWQTFRQVVKQTDPNALIVGELWQKDSTLLSLLDGTAADSTMNYRLRDAVLGLLVPPGQTYDGKGFKDSGHSLSATQFASRLEAQQEDYAPQVYSALMNLIDSHDTARALWDLTPGTPDTAAKEQNAANLAQGKQRLRIASLVQYTLPGMPTVYYGDEAGVTGADDPDNRRAYPWPDAGGKPDHALLDWYASLGAMRAAQPELSDGSFRVLLADDANGTVAYGRKDASRAAVVVLNTSGSDRTVSVPVGGWLPDGTALASPDGVGAAQAAAANGGSVTVSMPALSGVVLLSGAVDLAPPAAPAGLAVGSVGPGSVALHWDGVDGAASYAVYRSIVSGGGYVRAGTATGTSFTDTGAPNGLTAFYVVRALDAAGNESGDSNEVSALPSLPVGWAHVQWPPTIVEPLTAAGWTVYGQVYVAGLTDAAGAPDLIRAQLGWGGHGSDPSGWTWVDAAYNSGHSGDDNYEYMAQFRPTAPGDYDYLYRFSTDGGTSWTYGDQLGVGAATPGRAQISPPADTTPPPVPTGLHVVSASPTEVDLAWDASLAGDLAGYEIDRSSGGGPFAEVGTSGSPSFADTAVSTGGTYTYVVRAYDAAANVSDPSGPVTATAQLRQVAVTFTVTVPAGTPTGSVVHIAGTLDALGTGIPQWDPGATSLTEVDATHWTITLTGPESTYVEYKYTLGDWDHVEKDGSCQEIANRPLTLSYGTTGTQTVTDTVLEWRNVAPCGS